MTTYRAVLVPVDGSSFSEQALPWALMLAERAGAQLHVVLVREPMPAWAVRPGGGTQEAQARAAEDAWMKAVAERLARETPVSVVTAVLDAPDAGELAEYAVRQGFSSDLFNRPVAGALIRYAAQHHVDVVVLATHGRGALSRLWLGSVADQLLRHFGLPVLLVRPQEGAAEPKPGHRPALRHLLVPLDGSPFAESAVGVAVALARLTGARVTLFRLMEHALPFAGVAVPMPAEVEAEVSDAWVAGGVMDMNDLVGRLGGQGVEVAGEVRTGVNAPTAIVDEAHKRGCDAIVMSTHGAGGLRRFLLGSVTERVIRLSDLPVLAYRPPEAGGRPA